MRGLTALLTAAAAILAATPLEAQITNYAVVPTSSGSAVTVVDTATLAGTSSSIGGNPNCSAATADGRFGYVTTRGGGLVVKVDIATRAVVATLPAGNHPLCIALSPDGTTAWFSDMTANAVRTIDLATFTMTGAAIPVGDYPHGIAITPDGSRAFVANLFDDSVSVIDTATRSVVATIPVGSIPLALGVKPDGTEVFVSNASSGTVSRINVATSTVTSTIFLGGSLEPLDVSPDGQTLYVGSSSPSRVLRIDLATENVTSFAIGSGITTVAVSPDGHDLWLIDGYGSVLRRVDPATMQTTATYGLGSWSAGLVPFLGPNVIVGNTPYSIAGDADLVSRGFPSRFVDFNGGTLALTGPWTSARTVSLLLGGGTIDTGAQTATVTGPVIGEGALTKTGAGRLVLGGTNTHVSTAIAAGVLQIDGVHSQPIAVNAGALAGNGTIGAATFQAGTRLSPGGAAATGILTATGAMALASGVTLDVRLNGATAGTGYDRLAATGGVNLNGATLNLTLGYVPAPGASFTIVSNVAGTFGGLPEGAIVMAGGRRFRITYAGGSGSDVRLDADTAPQLSALGSITRLAGAPPAVVPFTVGDDFTAAGSLVVTATSSNQAVLPDANVLVGGAGSSRTLTLAPVFGMGGAAQVTVSVFDGVYTTTSAFTVTVDTRSVYFLAEGATSGFFDTAILLANPNGTVAPVDLRFYTASGAIVTHGLTLPATSRTTVHAKEIAGLEATAFSTAVVSTDGLPLVVERTVQWDASGYGAHSEKASQGAAIDWYFAEGAQGYFHTYFLLFNPHAAANVAHVTYFPEGGAPIQRQYALTPTARTTIDVSLDPALGNRSFATIVTFDTPAMAERATYFGDSPMFSGGHDSAGVNAASTSWLFAEGATGTFFDTFLLLLNPGHAPATVTMTYLTPTGTASRTHVVGAQQRVTLNLASEDPSLAGTAVAARVTSDLPIVAERSQYWPHGHWIEGHSAMGSTAPALRWGLADGQVGGPAHAQTYVLVANPDTQPATVTALFLRTNGSTVVKTFTAAPGSRMNIAITGAQSDVPELADEEFSVVLDATQPIVVERSIYSDAGGVVWAAGTNAAATRLP